MNENVYFISDVHLRLMESASEAVKENRLFGLFDEIKRQGASLWIVGDLFDFWFEYKYVIPRRYFSVLRKLKELTEAGCDVHILGGNHDYWLGSFISNEIGLKIHPSPIGYSIGGKSFFITHADGILKKDRWYRIMRWIFRNPVTIALFRTIHPRLAFALASKISGKSRHSSTRDAETEAQERNELITYGQARLKESYDYVITGHFHLPTVHSEGEKKIVNLGDWMKYFTFGHFNGQDFRLCYWKCEDFKQIK